MARHMLVAHDSSLTPRSIANALATAPGLKVFGTASCGGILQKVAELTIDLQICDIEMSEMEGPATLESLSQARSTTSAMVMSSSSPWHTRCHWHKVRPPSASHSFSKQVIATCLSRALFLSHQASIDDDYRSRSSANSLRGNATAVILTGMCSDRTRGLLPPGRRICFIDAEGDRTSLEPGVVDMVLPRCAIAAPIGAALMEWDL